MELADKGENCKRLKAPGSFWERDGTDGIESSRAGRGWRKSWEPGSGAVAVAGKQKPGAWGERWRGSLTEGESCAGLRFRAEKREERLQI